ncbi:MAG: hypothetical protein MUO77_03560 [Anaerolineales bacterium]|nr:hypothetical protein [Anaerolineales bacterium]
MARVSFTINIFAARTLPASGAAAEPSLIGLLHGSVVGAPAGNSVADVGGGDGVKLGRDVGLDKGVLVGTGVGGIAAWVIATKVFTAATAEACIWAESIIGTAFAPQALSIKATMEIIIV